MTSTSWPESALAILPGPDGDETDFVRLENGWIDDDATENMALACKWLGVKLVRVRPGTVYLTSHYMPGCTEQRLVDLIDEWFGFRPTCKALRGYYGSITEWASPALLRDIELGRV
jgi:hypothetical protein